MRSVAFPILTFALATQALGQSSTTDSTVTYALSWQECNPDGTPVPTPNGLLQPGESVLFRMSVSFTNQNGLANFSPPIGTFSSGTIRGFGAGFLDLIGTGPATDGSWNLSAANGLGVHPSWDLVGPGGWGTPSSNGSQLQAIQFGQFPASPASILGTNPIADIFRAVWTPSSYIAVERRFELHGAALTSGTGHTSVMLQLSPAALTHMNAPGVFGSVVIPIPAPASLPLLALAALLRQRSRR